MEVLANKRPADSEQSEAIESYAVCYSCSRLSKDLKTCDNCSSPLSESDLAQCYSSEPKRARLGSTSSSSNVRVSADSVSETVPSSLTSSVRPETLFVNVNNQAVPVLVGNNAASRPVVFSTQSSVSQAQCAANTVNSPTNLTNLRPRVSAPMTRMTVSSAAYQESVIPCNGNSHTSRSVTGGVNINTRPTAEYTSSVMTTNAFGQPRPSTVSVGHTDSYSSRPVASTQITLPTYNLQPPPPPFASNIARLPVAVANASMSNVVSIAGSAPTQNISVSAIQIRIGSKKYKPISPVMFKDDGILFTLKDYTYAPVLLNARAIVKCKANLNTFSYPVMFLFLEASCMKQIRSIFGLTNNEFMANSDVEIKRCISIFPIFGVEGKQHVQQLTFNIKRSFEAMVKRYPRSSAILEEITNDAVINILLEAASGPEAANTSSESAVTSTNVNSSSVSGIQVQGTITTAASTAIGSIRALTSTTHTSQGPLQANGAIPVSTERSLLPSGEVASGLANRVIAHGASVPASSTSTTSAPVLVIPSDANRWQIMQKNLVVGGVYHVQTPDQQKRYCLWNGTQLVPCMVQNTEVTLSCSQIRIGCFSAQCIGQVRIKADGSSGLYFTMKRENTGLQEIYLASSDMSSLMLCKSRISVIFVTLNSVGGEKLNSKMKAINSYLTFDSNSIDQKYILLFLTDVNHDQEEALKQMKFPSSAGSPSSVTLIDCARGLNMLATVRYGRLGTCSDIFTTNKLAGASGFDRLALELSESNGTESSVNDDDDDDVIMTQEELGVKCPYTQKVMIEPVRNMICNHNYEKVAIQEFILRKKGNAKCPYAGCANTSPLCMEDLVDNIVLKEYISKTVNKTSNQQT